MVECLNTGYLMMSCVTPGSSPDSFISPGAVNCPQTPEILLRPVIFVL